MSELKVIYLGPACQEQGQSSGREWCQDDVWDACECGHESVRYVLGAEFDRVNAEREALQQRLNAADQRIDDFGGGECEWHREDDSGIWNSGCGETWSFHEDGPEENGMHFCHSCGKHLVVEVAEQEQDDDWHMNPCRQGHRDVGASGGVAACNQCDEKIEAATTQEAFERWNATHPVAQPIRDQLPATTNMIDTLQPERIKGMIEARGNKFAIMIDEANAHYGWTFKKDPNGMWVSGRKATDAEMHAARTYARTTDQQ